MVVVIVIIILSMVALSEICECVYIEVHMRIDSYERVSVSVSPFMIRECVSVFICPSP